MSRNVWPGNVIGTLLLAAVVGLTACTAFKPRLEPPGSPSEAPPRKVQLPSVTYLGVPCYLHQVRWPEESLAVIARWYTGSAGNAKVLTRVTPNLRETDLRKGDVVFIPQELSRRAEPMSRSYARRYGKAAPSEKPPEPGADPQAQEDFPEDDLPPTPYGPRTFPD